MTRLWVTVTVLLAAWWSASEAYDPEDKLLDTVLPKGSSFEPFYPRRAYGLENGDSRPAHGHGTFYQHRHPALVDAANAPAYGFRFDGKRRFNFDQDEEEEEDGAKEQEVLQKESLRTKQGSVPEEDS